jgi:hypothetical protein
MAMALLVAGCATLAPSVPQDPRRMVGSWGGWLIKPRSFEWVNLEIRPDATFRLTGQWGIESTGVLDVQDGRVRFDGSRGWRGTMTLKDSPRGPSLTLERDDRTETGILRPRPSAGRG